MDGLIYVIRKDSLTAQGGEWKRRTKVGTETFKITDFFGRNRAFHGDEVIVSLCKPPTSVGKESNLSATFQSTPSEVETISSPAIHSIGEVEAPCFATAETYLPSMTSEFPHTLSLSSPLEEATPASPHLHIKEKIPAKDFTDASAAHTEWTDYCRIIGISKPSIHRKSIVCQLKPQNCAFNRVDVASNEKKSKNEVPPIKYIKLQPRSLLINSSRTVSLTVGTPIEVDFRLPPFQLNVETLSKVDKEHIHSSLVIEKETLVLVDFEEWNIHSILPTASICPLGFLGETGRISTENFATLIHYKLPHRPHIKESLKEITSLNCHSPSSSLPLWLERAMEDNHRRDCRDLDAFTIDPPSAKSKLDEEARKRATSVYFDNKVFPMLPSILSENLCSLLPNKDRLTFSVFFVLSSEGLLLESPKPEIIKTITRSRRRLDYALVERFLEDVDKNYLGLKDSFFPLDGPLPSLYEEKTRARLLHHLHPISKTWKLSNSTVISLLILRHMARLRRKIRQKEGSIVLFQGKHTILLNYDPKTELPFDMQYEWPSPTSHGIIEECMILANRCVAM
ncbi:RNB family domain-containing protein, partial [Cardiosporidium cionae]